MKSRVPGPLGFLVGVGWPETPTPLGRLDVSDPNGNCDLLGDTPGPLGICDWAEPVSDFSAGEALGRPVLLAMLGQGLALQTTAGLPSAEYRPNLNVNDATVEAYDHHFEGTRGSQLKQEIQQAATRVDVDPGLLAAYLFAEQNNRDVWLKSSGTVRGYRVGIDSWNQYAQDIKSRIPAASDVTVTGQEAHVRNEKGNVLRTVPIIRANDAIIASASYLKYAELRMKEFVAEFGGAWERLPIEERFTLARFGANAGLGAGREAVEELLARKRFKRGRKIRLAEVNIALSFNRRRLGRRGIEELSKEKPLRSATVHAAQAIHLSQTVFGVPFRAGDSVLLVR